MQTLGVFLKNNREAQNISLSEVSDYTKISKLYLDCLENDEYAKIPAKPYVKGYISSYASFIGIDEHEALKLYDSFQNETEDTNDINSKIPANKNNAITPYLRPNKRLWLVLVFLSLSIVSMAAYYFFFQNRAVPASKIGIEEQNIAVQPAVNSMTKPELLQKILDNYSFSARKQSGFDGIMESREIRKIPDNRIFQIIGPLAHHKPDGDLKEAVPSSPIKEISGVKGLPGSEDDKTIIENNLRAVEVTACTSIKDRIPQGIGNTFEWSTDRIYIWSRIQCKKPSASIRHIYYFKGEKVNDVLLNVRSSNWRTWSYKTLSKKRYIGRWRVDVASIEGNILNSINFEIK